MTQQDNTRYKFFKERNRECVNILFETPPVTKGDKYDPLTGDQIRSLIRMSANSSVYDRSGQWVRLVVSHGALLSGDYPDQPIKKPNQYKFKIPPSQPQLTIS